MKTVLPIACLMIIAAVAIGEEGKKEKKLTCVVSGKPAQKENAADYKGAQVYFCCQNCPKAFAKSPEKFATKANMQLVSTKQFRQVKCPLTGGPVNKEKSVARGGVKVAFCCDKCLAKAKDADDKAFAELAFSEEAFKKGFKVKKKKEADKKES